MDYLQLKVVTVDPRNPEPVDMDNINIPLFIWFFIPTKWFLAGCFSMNSMSGSHQLKLHIKALTKRPSGYAIIRATPLVMTQIKQKSPTPSMPWTLKRRLRRYNGNIRQKKLGLLFRVTKSLPQWKKRNKKVPSIQLNGLFNAKWVSNTGSLRFPSRLPILCQSLTILLWCAKTYDTTFQQLKCAPFLSQKFWRHLEKFLG